MSGDGLVRPRLYTKIQQSINLSFTEIRIGQSVGMEKVQLVHNCLTFEQKKRKYLYGMTNTYLTSNHLGKYKPDFIIIPSSPFINRIFIFAGVSEFLAKLVAKNKEHSLLDKILKNTKVIVGDEKKIQACFPSIPIGNLLANNAISLLKDHQLQEKALARIHLQLLNAQSSNQWGEELPTDLIEWFNCPQYQIKVIVPEKGSTTYLCQRTDILAIDPTQQFISYLDNNCITKCNRKIQVKEEGQYKKQDKMEPVPRLIRFLKIIVVTKMASVYSALQLLLAQNVSKVTVIVISQQLEEAIINNSRRYLRFPEEVTRSRLLIRNIGQQSVARPYRYPVIPRGNNPFILQSPSVLSCCFHPLSQKTQPYLELSFGSSIDINSNRRIIFYCPSSLFSTELEPETELTHFPYPVKEDNVDLVILYKVGEELMKELKSLPQMLRKKIILNRVEHKYNHKYFTTFQKNKIEHCLVTDTQYIQLMTFKKTMKSPIQSIESVLRHLKNKQVVIRDINKSKSSLILTMRNIELGAKLYELGNDAQIQTIGQVVEVLDGVVELRLQGSKKAAIVGGNEFQTQLFQNVEKVKAIRSAQIKTIPQNDYKISISFMGLQMNAKKTNLFEKPQKRVEELETSDLNGIEHVATIADNSLIGSLSLDQKRELNKICRPVTYEVGFKTNNHNENVYLISKGGMKWEDNDEIAGNGYFIGDLLSFYGLREGSLSLFDNYIEVVKDTWALQINIEEFHQFFILRYPHVLWTVFLRGKIFR